MSDNLINKTVFAEIIAKAENLREARDFLDHLAKLLQLQMQHEPVPPVPEASATNVGYQREYRPRKWTEAEDNLLRHDVTQVNHWEELSSRYKRSAAAIRLRAEKLGIAKGKQ